MPTRGKGGRNGEHRPSHSRTGRVSGAVEGPPAEGWKLGPL